MLRQCARRLAVAKWSTDLGGILQGQIAKQGPLSFAHFMDAAMRDADHGYFTTREKVIGSDADFVTAPELLPEFGWCVGNWLCQAIAAAATEGKEVVVVEAGPGTGRLMAHLLMFMKYEGSNDLLSRVNLRMVEVSPLMVAQQRKQLEGYASALRSVAWAQTLGEVFEDEALADQAVFVVSNEYLDVLPVHVMEKTVHEATGEAAWGERRVSVQGNQEFFLLPPVVDDASAHLAAEYISERTDRESAVGERLEVCPQAMDDFALVGKRIEQTGGMSLAIDYGKDTPSRNTLQGMHRQETCSPLLNPGGIDISWHVDFSAIRDHVAAASPSLSLTSAAPQADFLTAMGFDSMVQNRRGAGGALPQHFDERVKMLSDRTSMGGYHRVVALCHKATYPPPGCWASQRLAA